MPTIEPHSGFPNPAVPEIAPTDMETIRDILLERTGFHLESYKDKCIKRRIAIRIRASHSSSAAEYCRLLQHDERELPLLLKVLTIHVSHFFRNPSVFTMVRQSVIPAILDTQGRKDLTFWSVGCSSGEEPYSLALILSEYFHEQIAGLRTRIIGSDISEEILHSAQAGLFRHERLEELPEGFLSRYFTPERGMFRLNDEIRGMVQFLRSDLLDCRSFPSCDLVVCRNLLIYFEKARQEDILQGFAAALSPGGFLVLGKSETLVGEARKLFTTVCPVERIYRLITR